MSKALLKERKSEIKLPINESGPILRRTQRNVANGSKLDSDTTTVEMVSTVDRTDGILAANKRSLGTENTFRMEPDIKFRTFHVERITETILADRLKNVMYDPVLCKKLSQELASQIMEKVKSLNFKRYKLLAIVSIGSVKEKPGLQFGSRCLWNQNTDSFSSVKYSNGSLFAVALVYGLYFE